MEVLRRLDPAWLQLSARRVGRCWRSATDDLRGDLLAASGARLQAELVDCARNRLFNCEFVGFTCTHHDAGSGVLTFRPDVDYIQRETRGPYYTYKSADGLRYTFYPALWEPAYEVAGRSHATAATERHLPAVQPGRHTVTHAAGGISTTYTVRYRPGSEVDAAAGGRVDCKIFINQVRAQR